jgi:hypothetical protein
VKTKLFAALGEGIVGIAALSFLLATPASAQAKLMNAIPAAVAVSSANPQLPQETKIIAHVPLNGALVTRMYTQLEYGRTYLYIEQGRYAFTTVDISNKQNPQVVNHAPGSIAPVVYEQLFEGGSIEVSPSWKIQAGIDSAGGRGMRSVLESRDPNDAQLLGVFGQAYANLADRDRRLVYFASPSQLLVVQDKRMTEIDFITN